jgi:hypothetical protein
MQFQFRTTLKTNSEESNQRRISMLKLDPDKESFNISICPFALDNPVL